MADNRAGERQFKAGDCVGFLNAMRSASADSRSRLLRESLGRSAESFDRNNGAPAADLLYDFASALWEYDEPTALSVFREAARLGSDDAFAALGDALNWMGADAEAISWLRAAIERGVGDRSWLEGLLGESLLRAGQSSVAEVEYHLTQGLKSSTRFAIPLAQLLVEKGDFYSARDLLERATQDGQYGAAIVLGNLLCDRFDDHEAAEAAYKVGIQSGDAYSAHNLSVMLLNDGDGERAKHYHKLAMDMGDSSLLSTE